MKPALIRRLHKNFEDYVHIQDGVEFWFARDLQHLLGYAEWRNFLKVIEKARESCKNANNSILDHFVDANKSIPVPKGGEKNIDEILLTRYACYLIAQNGDPRKEEIAFAQSYFAVQTRKQEIIEDHIRLAERLNARKRLKDSEKELRPLADFLPTVTITAKNLATEITNFNITKEDLQGEMPITAEHVQNNQDIRDLLLKRGIRPETLPPEEDLIKLERRVKSQKNRIAKSSGKITSELPDNTQKPEDTPMK